MKKGNECMIAYIKEQIQKNIVDLESYKRSIIKARSRSTDEALSFYNGALYALDDPIRLLNDLMTKIEKGEHMTNENILKLAIEEYGAEAQTMMFFEEIAELEKELCKFARGKDNREQIVEEITDVEIMLKQLKMIHCITENDIAIVKEKKMKRLYERLTKDES